MDEKGLLSSTSATSSDESAEILVELARVAAVSTMPTGAQAKAARVPSKAQTGERLPCPGPFTYKRAFDPSEKGEKDQVGAELCRLTGDELKLSIDGDYQAHGVGDIWHDFQSSSTGKPDAKFVNGHLYRRALPYVVAIE